LKQEFFVDHAVKNPLTIVESKFLGLTLRSQPTEQSRIEICANGEAVDLHDGTVW
jgi:hypothetical protein